MAVGAGLGIGLTQVGAILSHGMDMAVTVEVVGMTCSTLTAASHGWRHQAAGGLVMAGCAAAQVDTGDQVGLTVAAHTVDTGRAAQGVPVLFLPHG